MIQQLIGLIILFSFFALLFLVAWYIALPLLLILFVVAVVKRLWYKIKMYMPSKQPVEQLQKSTPRRAHKKEVIDVDYTEV